MHHRVDPSSPRRARARRGQHRGIVEAHLVAPVRRNLRTRQARLHVHHARADLVEVSLQRTQARGALADGEPADRRFRRAHATRLGLRAHVPSRRRSRRKLERWHGAQGRQPSPHSSGLRPGAVHHDHAPATPRDRRPSKSLHRQRRRGFGQVARLGRGKQQAPRDVRVARQRGGVEGGTSDRVTGDLAFGQTARQDPHRIRRLPAIFIVLHHHERRLQREPWRETARAQGVVQTARLTARRLKSPLASHLRVSLPQRAH